MKIVNAEATLHKILGNVYIECVGFFYFFQLYEYGFQYFDEVGNGDALHPQNGDALFMLAI